MFRTEQCLFAALDPVPECIVKRLAGRKFQRSCEPTFDRELLNLLNEHVVVNIKNHGPLGGLFNGTMQWLSLAKHSLLKEDRLGNPNINFPIGVIFGDSDFFGSEGADDIVRQSKFFKSGESQLFKLKNSGHNMVWHNPKGITEVMVGFFKGTIKNQF